MANRDAVIWCNYDEFYNKAVSFIKPASTVMDIGCGIRPQRCVVPEFLICVEPTLEYIEILKTSLNDVNAVIVPLDALNALLAMPDRSIDSIFLIDVIEHMDKSVGARVLLECERVARQQVVVFTPLGFMPQDVHVGDLDGWNLNGGACQDHKSGWYPDDFLGWDIIGCKHLHFQDSRGNDISPPYGGFYAVKNVQKNENYYNSIYSNDVISSQLSYLPWLLDMFPLFYEKVVARDIAASHLICGLLSCQRTTELLIESGVSVDHDILFMKAAQEKNDALLNEAHNHRERIKKFAEQFVRLNDLSSCASELDAKNAKLNEMLDELLRKKNEISGKEVELEERDRQLASREKDLNRIQDDLIRREQIIANSRVARFALKVGVY